MKPIVVIVGPTGIGKTKLSIALAKQYNAEIISADAMQFYKGLSIGTAKVMPEEQENIPHHLIDILEPEESFSVAEYQKTVRSKIDELRNRDVMPILVGGSGLYVQSILYDYRFEGQKRAKENTLFYDALGTSELYDFLVKTAPEVAKTVHPNNRIRVMRMLEIAQSVPALPLEERKTPYYDDFILIGLEMPRALLYQRIEERVTKMFDCGLIDEAKMLYDRGINTQSSKAIGYKELFPYFANEITLIDAIDQIKTNSRRYAKRQLTWFKNQMSAKWFTVRPECFEETIDEVKHYLDSIIR